MGMEPEIIDGPERRVSPVLIVLLVVVVLAALAIFVVLPLFTAEETEPFVPPADTAQEEPADEAPAEEEAPEEQAEPEETFEVFEARDPFRPLVTAGAPIADGTTDGAVTGDGDTSGAAGAPAPTGGQRVTLRDIFQEDGVDVAQVQVNSTVFTVAEGEVFADNFMLVSISGECATMLHGDDKFTLCVGEEVIK